MVGTVFGCLILGMISNGLNLLGVNANYQIIVQGALILLALVLDVESTKMLLRLDKYRMLRARTAGVSAMSAEALVEMRNVSKSFGGVQAVDNVSLQVNAGEVVGLLGHNGAGKSTLIKILSGAHTKDTGNILVGGSEGDDRDPGDAKALGIETIYQTLALADNLDAVANLFLGREIRKFGSSPTAGRCSVKPETSAVKSTRGSPT